MSANAIPAEANDNPGPHGPNPHDADAQGYRKVLHDLITMGADLARCLHAQATVQAAQQAVFHPTQTGAQQSTGAQPTTEAQPAPASDALISLTIAFDRIARAVRRSIMLARSLAQPAPIQPGPGPARHRAAARRRIIREVEDAIQRTASSPNNGRDAAETLQAELRDRLDAPDLDDDITLRPTADIISEICRDLGLAAPPGGAHPWKRRTPDDITQLCAQAAAPSTACQPGPGPQESRRGVAQPGPMHPGNDPAQSPPDDTAGTVPTILRRPTPVHSQRRPPPTA